MVFKVVDRVFFVIFASEAALKIIASGFIFHPAAYLMEPWNVLDFVVLITSSVSTIVNWVESGKDDGASHHLSVMRVLRLFRTLRPLRMLSRNKEMQIIVVALCRSIPAILNGIALTSAFILIFALFGLQVFFLVMAYIVLASRYSAGGM